MNKLFLVGIGPGSADGMTQAAKAAREQSAVLCGYTVYLDLVRQQYPDKETYTTPMTRELERCRWAIDRAAEGKTVAMLCSGDAGVYGMAGPVLELAEGKDIEIEVVPGVTAALSGAAILGAPLMHDFCVISLSDLLTPWEVIERRLRCAAAGDFSIALYNPRSKKRPDHLRRACEILLEEKSPDTVCGWVKNIGRPGQCHGLATLKDLGSLELDMFTTVFIGASSTKNVNGRMVTPRGYRT
ncbi:MAG: precorrin-3B C(17)-methyltransferase [Oscillospiraceae bacterium]|nr:precorrin-3B C(17)-methyltransferase [Oscillospiraceae bacterium]